MRLGFLGEAAMRNDRATDQSNPQQRRIYAEGYDAFLRFVHGLGDWVVIVNEAPSARRSPYEEDSDFARAWLEGWRDAVAETYIPPAFTEPLAPERFWGAFPEFKGLPGNI
jgi:hypothetical protein